MNLQILKSNKGARHRRKRVGRGNGSGMGTFSCRGMNGQNSRAGGGVRPGFEGGQTAFIQRMPKLKGFKNPSRVPFQVVNVKDLDQFSSGATVDVAALFEQGLVAKKNLPVKILGDGDITTKVTVKVESVSKSAQDKITKAGGTCELTAKPKAESEKAPANEEKPAEETPAEEESASKDE